jgi:adenosine deaminase
LPIFSLPVTGNYQDIPVENSFKKGVKVSLSGNNHGSNGLGDDSLHSFKLEIFLVK